MLPAFQTAVNARSPTDSETIRLDSETIRSDSETMIRKL